MSNLPPPANVATNLPDYYFGQLIYFDEFGEDSCRWVIYDGLRKWRFPSKKAAMRWAESQKIDFPKTPSARLERARALLDEARDTIDREADNAKPLEAEILRKIAFEVRKISDTISNLHKLK